jgi:hypothetical protein
MTTENHKYFPNDFLPNLTEHGGPTIGGNSKTRQELKSKKFANHP